MRMEVPADPVERRKAVERALASIEAFNPDRNRKRRPSPEPHTHYDHNDGHHYGMHDVLDPPELGEACEEMTRRNIVMIRGTYYTVESYSDPDERGNRTATLKFYDPERPF